MSLGEAIAQQPLWLQIWVYWMVITNLAGILFVRGRVEARWVVGAFLVNGVFMSWLNDTQGFTRLLGLSHAVVVIALHAFHVRILKQREHAIRIRTERTHISQAKQAFRPPALGIANRGVECQVIVVDAAEEGDLHCDLQNSRLQRVRLY